ncbi:MAG: LysR family transcriptional regulator [Rhodospirillaceae bacterium]
MNFRDLSYVLAIAEHKTISRAAEALCISQPSLSRFLSNLEETLKVRLFERSNKRMQLTYAGRRFVETANHILVLYSDLHNELNEVAHSERGWLRIGCTQAHGKYILPRCFALFKQKYPKFHITLQEGGVDLMRQHLLDGKVDLSLYSAAQEDRRDEELVYHCIHSEEIVLALPQDERFRRMAVPREGFRYPWLDLRELADLTFLMMPANWRVGRVGRHFLKESGIDPTQILFASLETGVSAAAHGVGGFFVADMCVDYFESRCQPAYYSVGEEPQLVDFFVAQRKSSILTQAQHDFIDMVRTIYTR